MVNFFSTKHHRNTQKRNNKKIAVGQLLGSKTDVKEAEEDEGREDDNVSALELALNHSDTVAADVGQKVGPKKLYNFRLIPPLLSRRRGSQNSPPGPVMRNGEDKRDDCTDKSLVDLHSLGTIAGHSSINVDKQSMVDSIRMDAPLEVTVTPESLTGLLLKRNSPQIKSSSVSGTKGSNGVKVKGYIRVVGKAAGVKIVSGSTKIVKSYRLGTSTISNTNPSHSPNTLIFSNVAAGMKPTGSLRIRIPPPTTTSNNSASYVVLNFEVGVLTPEGIFPLGTTTYQPLHRSSKLHHNDVLKVDAIQKGSLFQRRKPLVYSPKSAATTAISNKDSFYRLQRKSKLSLNFDIKLLSDKEYILQQKQKLEPKSITNSVAALPTSLSCPALEDNNETTNHEFPHDEATLNELRNAKSDPNGGLIMYLSDPLSCCSDRDVDSGDDEVVPDDGKTQVTEASVELLNEDAQSEAVMSVDVIEPQNIVQEIEQQPETSTLIDQNTESYGWCYIFPICCCVGTCIQRDDEIQKNVSTIKNGDIPIPLAKQYEKPISDGRVSDDLISNKYEQTSDQALNRSRHRYGDEVSEILESYSDMKAPQDKSVVGTRNCCMACFGDEDVEDLKFATFESTKEHHEFLDHTEESTDAVYEKNMENVSQLGSHEPTYVKQENVIGQEQQIKALGSTVEIAENSEENNLVDGFTASRVDAALDTMTSSYAEDEDSDSVYSMSFSEDLDIDGNVGCFQWMDAVSSEGLETNNSMSVMSSGSQIDFLEKVVADTREAARIPISKSEDVTILPPTTNMKNIPQSNFFS